MSPSLGGGWRRGDGGRNEGQKYWQYCLLCGRYAHFVSEPAVVQLAIFFHEGDAAQGEEGFAQFASDASLSNLLVGRESDSMAAQQGLQMAFTSKSHVLDGACDWDWGGGAGGLGGCR